MSLVLVLANPKSAVSLWKQNLSSRSQETGSVISLNEVESLNRISKEESEILKLQNTWPHQNQIDLKLKKDGEYRKYITKLF